MKATRNRIGIPVEMPPRTPPARFVSETTRPSSIRSGSLCSLPKSAVPANPEPISKPLAALIASIAPARPLSSLSNTGSPSPAGAPTATHSTTPPTESPAAFASAISASILTAASGSGQRTAVRSTASRVTSSAGSGPASMSFTRWTKAVTRMPRRSRRKTPASAPAATWAAVTRAEDRPPPRWSRIPYLAAKVKSAWPGRYTERSGS